MALIQRVFSISAPQEEWLLSRSAQLGISHAELMRRIMDAARGEMGELLMVSSKAPALFGAQTPPAQAPTERAAAIAELMRYCRDQHIPERAITPLLAQRMGDGDWRQADAADYRSVLFTLRYGSDPPLFAEDATGEI
jgi:hypothetical protein